ncbi:hypothetical protein A1F96_09794 [Pyrenophora tritici-repentis]|nr:hypothetical protein A1F96_09794 [Pyrenophora tritici-repentis]
MTSISTSSCSSNGKHVTQITTSVSRNISSGNAVQINGPVADKIYNLNFKNLVIRCQCSSASKTILSANESALRSKCACTILSRPKVVKASTSASVSAEYGIEIPQSALDGSYPGQNLSIYSRSSGQCRIVRALFAASVSENFVSHRIVKRLKLEAHNDPSVAIEATWGLTRIPPTSEYVSLTCRLQEGNDCVTHRFYVVKLYSKQDLQQDFDQCAINCNTHRWLDAQSTSSLVILKLRSLDGFSTSLGAIIRMDVGFTPAASMAAGGFQIANR